MPEVGADTHLGLKATKPGGREANQLSSFIASKPQANGIEDCVAILTLQIHQS